MQITFDPAKRQKTLTERGLDFADADLIFAGMTLEMEDTRKDYGETRVICYGLLLGRLVVWSFGRFRLRTAWRGSPRLQYEESQ